MRKKTKMGCLGAFRYRTKDFIDCKGLCCSSCKNKECKARCKAETIKDCPYRKLLSELIFSFGVFQNEQE